ncbi:CPBP family intramembrane glutamic endopeptidase [Paenibacillus sp. MSJ-34]|uniref:CPBP family intramembrane glutamic endopeptidase n=1 Tax=Paenibacillus sp. MSJ-34 TaxID=2841529 RepID=UPI001C111C97|nr:type II CAAX endopeptidase family protein [Paenibacillus sp. MSJ-34]MBU5443906.1 CPBP family intramembrane metalloprotease [Paenibacillus sp. MSJ-34]
MKRRTAAMMKEDNPFRNRGKLDMFKKSYSDLYVFIAFVYIATTVCIFSGIELIQAIGQATPLLGVVLVRLLFRMREEKPQPLGLKKLGGIRWHLFALLAGIPVMFSFLTAWLLGLADLPALASLPEGITQGDRFMMILRATSAPLFLLMPLVFALTEEVGWRGYLQPRLTDIFGERGAVFVTGAIWAFYHYPFYAAGYNDAGDVGINMALFTLTLLPLSAVMGWIRIRSGSIWPLVLFHAVINHQRTFWESVFYEKQEGWNYVAGEAGLVSLLLWTIMAVVLWMPKLSRSQTASLRRFP